MIWYDNSHTILLTQQLFNNVYILSSKEKFWNLTKKKVKDFSEFFSSRRGKKIDKNCDQFISINQIYFNRIIFASFSDRTDYFSIKKRFNKKQHLHSSIPIGVQIRVRIWRRANIIAITPLITVCSCQGNQAATRNTFSREIRVRQCTYMIFFTTLSIVWKKEKLERAWSTIRTILNETRDKSRGNENSIRANKFDESTRRIS